MRCVQLAHDAIAMRLGQYACCSDGPESGIASDDACVRDTRIRREPVPIDEKMLRVHAERSNGPMHGEKSGAEDVDGVDFGGLGQAYRPRQGFRFDQRPQRIALRFAQFLAIVKPWEPDTGGQDHRSGYHRAGQTATSCFIAAGLKKVLGVVSGERQG